MRILLGTHITDQMTKKLDFLFFGGKGLDGWRRVRREVGFESILWESEW